MPSKAAESLVRPGTIIGGRFEITEELVAGGFGRVFLATDRDRGGKVVIKLSAQLGDRAHQALLRELSASKRLPSPPVAPVLGEGVHADRFYIVREYVEGETLTEILARSGRLSVDETMAISIQIARGLSHVHASGLLHRDLKPSNVVVSQSGVVILLDLGVAGELTATGTTMVGQVWGTPKYMSPEQFLGEAQSPATDVYGLGLLMYEMVVGKPPFQEATLASRVGESLSADVEVRDPSVPVPLAQFISRCLQRDPSRRPGGGAEALMQLEEIRRRIHSADIPPQTPDSGSAAVREVVSRGFRAKPMWVFLLLVVVAAILIAGTAVFSRDAAYSIPMLAVVGVLLMVLGAGSGVLVQHFISNKGTAVQARAGAVLADTGGRDVLTATIMLQVDELIESVKGLDQSIMAKTVALMLREYHSAKDSKDKQDALLKSVDLLEKLMDRMTPWYVRYQKLLVFLVTGTGVVTGLISIYQSLSE